MSPTPQMACYPTFRDNIENYIISYIHSSSLLFHKSVISLIEMETAYMNTTHEDFINSW